MTLHMVAIVVGCNCMRKRGAKIKSETVSEKKERREMELRAHKKWERKRVIQLNSQLNIEHEPKYIWYGTVHYIKIAGESTQK